MSRRDLETTTTVAAAQFEADRTPPLNDVPDPSLCVGPTDNDWGLSLDQHAELIRAVLRGDAA